MGKELPSDASYEEFCAAFAELCDAGDEVGAISLRDSFPHLYDQWCQSCNLSWEDGIVFSPGEEDPYDWARN